MAQEKKSTHILIVEDDKEIREGLASYLRENNLEVTTAADGDEMQTKLSPEIDLIVLDVMLPGKDGLTLCRELRTASDIPVIMLTARGEPTDRVLGIEMGADDYIVKPFHSRELLSRINAVLRRADAPGREEREAMLKNKITFANWVLDLDSQALTSKDDLVVSLTPTEFRLLEAFLTHPNRLLSRDQLMNFTHGRDASPVDRSIDVTVGRLRQHLNDSKGKIIKTMHGQGYMLDVPVKRIR